MPSSMCHDWADIFIEFHTIDLADPTPFLGLTDENSLVENLVWADLIKDNFTWFFVLFQCSMLAFKRVNRLF